MAASKPKRTVMIQAFERAGIKPWSRYIEYLLRAKQYSGATDLDAYLDAYAAHRDRERATPEISRSISTPEDLCEKSNTSPGVIIGHIARQLWETATPEGNVLQAMSHIDIIQAWIRQAKKPEGFNDRREFLKANGVIPIPSNQTIHLHKHYAASQTVEGKAPGTLPNFEADLGDDDLPMLPAGKS